MGAIKSRRIVAVFLAVTGASIPSCANRFDPGPALEPTIPLVESVALTPANCKDGASLRRQGRLAVDWEGGVFQPTGTSATFVVAGDTKRFFVVARGRVVEACYFVDVEGHCSIDADRIPSDLFVFERVLRARRLGRSTKECLPAFDDLAPW